jgi:hypothetical protein
MKREKRVTKRERKAAAPPRPAPSVKAKAQQAQHQHHGHIHCIACGKHLDPSSFGEADGADFLRCQHGSDHPHCVGCVEKARVLVEEHDRTNTPVQVAAAWH